MENEINIFCKMLKQILCTLLLRKHIFDSSFNNAPRIRKIVVYNKIVCSDTLDYTYFLSTKIPKREKDADR